MAQTSEPSRAKAQEPQTTNGEVPFGLNEHTIDRMIKSYVITFVMLMIIYYQQNFKDESELQYQVLVVEFILDFIRDNLISMNYKQIPFFLIILYLQKSWINLIYIFATTTIGFDAVMNKLFQKTNNEKLKIIDYVLILNYALVYLTLIHYTKTSLYFVLMGHLCLFFNWFS